VLTVVARCKMNGKETRLPCSAVARPLFGDCLVEYEKHYNANAKQTKADCIRVMPDEKMAKYLVEIGWDCHLCSEHRRLDNEPLFREEKCDEQCEKHCLEWLKSTV